MNTALMCMAMALYFEARSEPLDGQYKVAEVVMNRVASPKYPMDTCGVIKYDPGSGDNDCHFSFWCDGKAEVIDDPAAFEKSLGIAIDVLTAANKPLLPQDAMWYHTKDVSPSWANNLVLVSSTDTHLFYGPKSASK